MHTVVELSVNGDRHSVGVPSHYTLLETLRYGLGLTGSKQGCDKGDCGACTVLRDGEAVLSCIMPVHEAAGRQMNQHDRAGGSGERQLGGQPGVNQILLGLVAFPTAQTESIIPGSHL